MNVFPKFGFSVALRLVILCFGMLYLTATAQAQDNSNVDPFLSTNWLSSPEAVTALDASIDAIEQTIQSNPPANVVPIRMRHELFSQIRESIQDGSSVRDAAQMQYFKLAPSNHTDVAPTPDMTNQDWQTLLDDMIDLLTD